MTATDIMVYAPPSYHAAIYRQLWSIIAPYLQDEDLYSACLVCRHWHQIMAPRLWGSPASRFGSDSDTVYLSLTRFKRLLNRARLDVRRLAHTLHIPPAETEFYGGPQAGWLRDILDRLPALQALNVSNLSFFDHQSLQTIHHSCQPHTKYPLKLLVAAGCENTTASSLSVALEHFPDLIYLDLSGAQGSRNPYVLRQIGTLHNLQVLKLRNCGLRDDDIDHLTFTPQLRSLDLSQNFLTKRGVYKLSALLPMPAPLRRETVDSMNSSSPFARRYSGVPPHKRVLEKGVEKFVADRLMRGMDGDIAIEEGLPESFSHLYLASNYVSIDSLSRLIERPNLQHLDAGSLSLNQSHDMLSPRSVGSGSARFSNPPEVETLSPALFTHAFRNLRSLRLHYSVVTSNPFSRKELAVEEQCFELHGEDLRYELDSTPVLKPGTFELEDTSQILTHEPESVNYSTKKNETGPEKGTGEETHATFESPDDVGVQFNPTAPVEIKGSSSAGRERNDAPISPIERKIAPPRISISLDTSHIPNDFLVSPINSVPEGPEIFRYKYAAAPEKSWQEALNRTRPSTPKEIIEEVTQRKHRIEARERHPGRFKPSMLPNLKSLTLTDVPSTTRRRNVTSSLITFIQELAEEEEIARLEGAAAKHHKPNNEPPFKIQTLLLEMTSLPDPILPSKSKSPHPTHPHTSRQKRHSFTKSSTEDADSETFMSYSSTDFSFFSEDDGGLLVSEGRIDAPMNFDEGMMVDIEVDNGHVLDVVSELASFRREKKKRFQAYERWEGNGDGVEKALGGHWRGEIKIIKAALG